MMLTSFELIGFGPKGWGYQILDAALMTVAVSCSAFLIGCCSARSVPLPSCRAGGPR